MPGHDVGTLLTDNHRSLSTSTDHARQSFYWDPPNPRCVLLTPVDAYSAVAAEYVRLAGADPEQAPALTIYAVQLAYSADRLCASFRDIPSLPSSCFKKLKARCREARETAAAMREEFTPTAPEPSPEPSPQPDEPAPPPPDEPAPSSNKKKKRRIPPVKIPRLKR